jgi:adenosine deaminase CECR1
MRNGPTLPRSCPAQTTVYSKSIAMAVMPSSLKKTSDAVVLSRNSLISASRISRLISCTDHSFRNSLSPIARRADAIVARIRAEEQQTVWTAQLEEDIAQSASTRNITVHPGMMFSLAKDRMESTKLWRIVRRLPKGALLHAHMDAMVEFDFMIDVVMNTPGMCVHVEETERNLATEERRREGLFLIRFRKEWPDYVKEKSIWEDSYMPGTPQPLKQVAEDFPDGGRTGFVKWLYSRCCISQTDSVEAHHGLDAIWDKFKKCFLIVGSMLHYEPIFRQFMRRLLSLLVADGVQWVELRSNRLTNFSREGSETFETDNLFMFEIIEDEVKRFKATEEGKKFWGLRGKDQIPW